MCNIAPGPDAWIGDLLRRFANHQGLIGIGEVDKFDQRGTHNVDQARLENTLVSHTGVSRAFLLRVSCATIGVRVAGNFVR